MFAIPFATISDFTLFSLVVGRMAGLFSAIPLFGGKSVPMRIKMAVIMSMALLLFPIIKMQVPPLPGDSISIGLLVIRETLIGLTLGIISQAIFAAVEMCGQIVGMQMGISIAALFDPNTQSNVPTMSLFQGILAMLLFVALGVHHIFIRAIVESYQVIPVGAWHMSGELMQFFITSIGAVFILGVKLAAPVMVALLATSVALGIMARAFPQMNIFMVSMPLNIGIGFLALGLSLLAFLRTLENSFGGIDRQIKTLFKLLA
ncbi:flagellar biosynthetic protein FliR [Geotalea toluenoxydans]|uniref:flagellar biosynthetic protein FliR n=1 Tax=Geotalea toluenoxydans TaxID=421624 RepID=UPI0006CF9836|nr:flagellar biosynthetic protein FliR [Geotalea toluenoxydans]